MDIWTNIKKTNHNNKIRKLISNKEFSQTDAMWLLRVNSIQGIGLIIIAVLLTILYLTSKDVVPIEYHQELFITPIYLTILAILCNILAIIVVIYKILFILLVKTKNIETSQDMDHLVLFELKKICKRKPHDPAFLLTFASIMIISIAAIKLCVFLYSIF
ncbi:MAG: hypothetical protein ACTSYD_05310 [Candidatus Heimdallarchaeaceae archaeon]